MKDKTTAALLAFFLGAIGVHKFYLGQTGAGVVYLIFFWTAVPAFIAFIEFILLLAMDQAEFDRRFNYTYLPQGPTYPQQQIVINNAPGQHEQAGEPFSSSTPQPAPASNLSVADELKKLNELRVAGVLTEEEFIAHKQKLLS